MIYAIIITVISLFVLKKLLGICINALYVGKVGIPQSHRYLQLQWLATIIKEFYCDVIFYPN